jgi:hypothetical protein
MAEIESFLGEIGAGTRAFRVSRALYAPQLAPEFDWLSVLSPNELGLSRLLAWIVDPQASHAQGDTFLRHFLDTCKIQWSDVDSRSAVVATEVGDLEGRFDVLIVSQSGAQIIVENKPYAADQELQLERYLRYMGERGQVIYLAGFADQRPSEFSIAPSERERHLGSGRLIEMSWVGLSDFFGACARSSRSQRVRALLEEIPLFVAKRFEGIVDMTESDHIVSQIMRTPDTIQSAMLVAQNLERFQEQMCIKLHDQVQALAGDDLIVHPDKLDAKKYASMFISFRGLMPRFYLNFETAGFRLATVGVQDEMHSLSAVERDALHASLGQGQQNDDYPWWAAVQNSPSGIPANWLHDVQPWLMIHDGTLAQRIVDEARRVGAALAQAVTK